jgi:hippurate hydrolase
MNLLTIPFLEELAALRRDLHAYPEIAVQETRTADGGARALSACGLKVHRGLAGTGVVGVLRKGGGRQAIGLRADMDALPMMEKNVFPHASRNPGRMHACGHDGHAAMLLGAARYLAENAEGIAFDGTVYFIFQPAEESEGGGRRMVSDGLFRRFPMGAIFGLHNWPDLPAGEMAVMSGPVMAGTSVFEIRLRGRGCHAALPHQGADTLVAASHLVLGLQTIVARNVPPFESAVVSVTQIHGGDALNVIPDDAVLRGTIRSFKPEVEALVAAAIRRISEGVGSTFDVQVEIDFDQRYPVTANSAAEAEICAEAAVGVLGAANLRRNESPSMAAEDFSYMLQEKPGCYVWLGNGSGSDGRALHNPYYDFNDGILAIGVSYWIRLIETALRPA